LTGWLAGPSALAMDALSDEEIIAVSLTSLANIFKIPVDELKEQLTASKVCAWGRDPYTKGAYSYLTPQSGVAIEELNKPVENKLYFAGEALYDGEENGTVEAALATGKKAAEKILSL
jgi:monoamine oxidase